MLTISTLNVNIQFANQEAIMATLQQVLDSVASIASSLAAIRADITSLKDQLAQGMPVTQDQLDNLFSLVASVASDASQLDSENP